MQQDNDLVVPNQVKSPKRPVGFGDLEGNTFQVGSKKSEKEEDDEDFLLPDPQSSDFNSLSDRPSNPYFVPSDSDDFQLPDPQKDSVTNSYTETAYENSDEAAKIIRLSKRFNLDPDYVAEHLSLLTPLGDGPTKEYLEHFEEQHPDIAAFLRQRHNMVVAKDDLDNLGTAAQNLKELAQLSQISSWDAGQLGVDAGMLGWDRIWDSSNPTIKPKLEQITKQLETFNQDRPTGINLESVVDTTVEQLPMFWGMAKYGATGGVAASTASLPFSWLLGPAAPIGAGAAFGSGVTAGVGAFNFKVMAGHAYNELDQIKDDQGNPFPENVKQLTAIVTGAAQAGLAYVPLIGLLKKIPGAEKAIVLLDKSSLRINLANPKTAPMAYKQVMTEFMKNFAEASVHVGAGMAGIKAVGLTGEEVAKSYTGQPFSERRSVLQIGSESAEAGLHAMKDFGVISMIGPSLQVGSHGISRAFKSRWDNLAEAAQRSKLLERSPEQFQEFLAPLIEAFPNKSGLFKPKELKALFQTLKLDPEAEFVKLGITEEADLAEAIGGKVEIPLDKLLATYGKKEIEGSEVKGQTVLHQMGELITFDHDADSLRDLNEQGKKQEKKRADTKKEFDADVAEGEEAVTQNEKFQEDRKRIEKDMASKMDAIDKPAGMNERQWKETKKQTAKVQSAIMVTRAKRRGLDDAWKVYQDSNTHFLNEQDEIPLHMKRHVLERIKYEVDQGDYTQGGYTPQQDQSQLPAGVEANKFIPSSSTYPEYFKNKNLNKKTVLNALQKQLEGDSLTASQRGMIEDLYRASGFDSDVNEEMLLQKGGDLKPGYTTLLKLAKIAPDKKIARQLKNIAGLLNNAGSSFDKAMDLFGSEETKAFINSNPLEMQVRTPFAGKRKGPKVLDPFGHSKSDFIEMKNGDFRPPTSEDIQDVVKDDDPLFQTKTRDNVDTEGQPIFQGAEAKPLGAFYPQHYPEQTIIRLFSGANQSTTVHELAHVSLLDTFNYIKEGLVKTEWQEGEQALFEENLKDWKTLAAWLKIDDAQKELTVDQQEQFARGFEVYLREGKAPTSALRKTFEFFKNWLTKIYKKAQMLDVQMTDEIRSVFDNLVASDEEISFASEEFGFLHELDYSQFPEQVGSLVRGMIGIADERSTARQSSEFTAEAILEKTQEALKEAKSELELLPSFQAVKLVLQRFPDSTAEVLGKRLLDNLDASKESGLFPDEVIFCLEFEKIAEAHEQSSLDLARDLVSSGGVEQRITSLADQIYQLKNNRKDSAKKNVHNFKRLEVLLLEKEILQAMRDHKKWIRKEEGLARKKKAKEDADAIRAEVKEEFAQDRREVTENLIRIKEKVKSDLKSIREQAQNQLLDASVRRSGAYLPYFTAEKNAAALFEKAVQRRDWESAEKYKNQQVRAHALAIEAIKNSKEIPRILKRFGFFQKRGTKLLKIPFHNVHLIDELMARNGLTKERPDDPEVHRVRAEVLHTQGVEPEEITDQTGFVLKIENGQDTWEQESLTDFAARKSNAYFNFYLPDSVLRSDGLKDFSDLKLSELRDLRDTVEIIYKLGQNADKFLSNQVHETFDAAVLETKLSITGRFKNKYGSQNLIGSEPGEGRVAKGIKHILDLPDVQGMLAVTTLSLCDVLDGRDPNGPMKKYVYRVLKAADDRKNERIEKATGELDTIIKKHFSLDEFSKLKKEKVFIQSLGRDMTKDQIIAVGLNFGNETNRRRIVDGYKQVVKENGVTQYTERSNPITRPMNEQEMGEIVSHLSERDLDFCQDIWDYLETYWPEIFNLEVQVAGLEPKKVEALPFKAHGKTYRGGYYPIDYDSTRSTRKSESDKQQNALYKTNSGTMSQTSHGHTEARVRSVRRPINLDTDVLFEHVNNVIHDLCFRKAIIDVNKFLSKSEITDAIGNSIGKKALQTLKDSLNFVASDQRVQQTDFERNILKPLRTSATYSVLGFKLLSIPVDLSGNIINLAQERGTDAIGDLKQSITFAKGVTAEVGLHLAQVMPDVVGKPLAAMIESNFEDALTWKNHIHEKSIRMRKRAKLINRDLYDLSKTLRGETSTFKRYAFMTQVFADEMISQPLWASVYKESLNKGFSETDSIHLADESVTSTFGSGSSVDLSAVQRGGEFQKLLTYWYSWNGMMFNRMWKEGKIAGITHEKGNSWDAAFILGKSLAFSVALHGFNEWFWRDYILRNSTPGRPDKKEDERKLSRFLRQGAGYIPIAGPVIDYSIDKTIMGDSQAHLSLPAQSAFETLFRPVDDFFKTKSDREYLNQENVEHLLNSASMLVAWPKQLNILLFNFADSLNKDDLRMNDLFSRRIKK